MHVHAIDSIVRRSAAAALRISHECRAFGLISIKEMARLAALTDAAGLATRVGLKERVDCHRHFASCARQALHSG
jgi:hypothetical protein